MSRVAIVTDSTSDLPPELAMRYGITVVPLTVQFGDETFLDGVELSADTFLTRLRQTVTLPRTSQPAPGRFEETFRRLATDHDAIVAVHISARLSGTLSAAAVAQEAVRGQIAVEVVDARSASLGLGFQALRAAELAAAGLDAPAIAERLRAETDRYHVAFFADTLDYLQRGGRIGRAQALVGSLLRIKPLLMVDEGQVVPLERTRTRGQAIRGLIDFAAGFARPRRIGVIHSASDDRPEALIAALTAQAPGCEIVVTRMGPVILTHLGPGAMGVVVQEGESVR